MSTSQWVRSGDTQLRLTVFERAYSTALGRGATCDFFEGGTTTPKPVFFDSGQSEAAGAQVTVDANARWPHIFIPTGNPYDYIIRDFDGTIIDQGVNIPNPNPAETGTAPIGNVETGDVLWSLRQGTRTSYVRCNGRTIGSSASGATELADTDLTENLYTFIWNNSTQDTNPVIGGRGASAAADFTANKPITLPDMRAGGPIGEDGMGSDDTGAFVGVPFTTGNAGTIGSLAGYNTKVVAIAEMESHFHTLGTLQITAVGSQHRHDFTTGDESQPHSHDTNNLPGEYVDGSQAGSGQVAPQTTEAGYTSENNNVGHTHDGTTDAADQKSEHGHGFSGQMDSVGGGNPYNVVQRSTLGTWYIRL